MSIINEALKQLKEEWKEEDILDQQTVDSLNAEAKALRDERTEMNKLSWADVSKLSEEEKTARRNRLKEISSRLVEIQQKLHKHELTQRYFTSSDQPATDEDWEDLFQRLPEEFEFEDLEVEVETEEDDEPTGWNYRTDSIIYTTYPAQHGYVNTWTITIEPSEDLVAEFLNKPIEEITSRDLAAIDEDDYTDFILNNEGCIEQAREAAAENWEYDDVSWDEPPEPDYDDYYDDRD